MTRYTRKAGDHARAAHDELVALSPLTTEVQFDEKWSFVAKKEAHCDRSDPADDHKGDYWDHVAYDPEHRLVVAVVPGARDVEGTEALVGEFRRRTGGRVDEADDQRRLPGLRGGDPARLRRGGHAAADRAGRAARRPRTRCPRRA